MATTAALSIPNRSSDQNGSQELAAILSGRRSYFYRMAFRCLGNTADAEDAVQDALLSAYKHRDQFRGQAQARTWVTAIIVNSARMQLRRRSRAPHVSLNHEGGEAPIPLLDLLTDPRRNPEQEYCASELADSTAFLLARLSSPLRQAIQLREFEGLSIREIASKLGLPEGTVKARLSRARTKLRDFLKTQTAGMRRRVGGTTTLVARLEDKPRALSGLRGASYSTLRVQPCGAACFVHYASGRRR